MKQFRETKYWITEDGRVIYDQKRERKLQNVNGGLQVMIYLNHKNTFHFVNRLVAECYIPNPDNLPHVIHIDGDKMNNHVSNLKWGIKSTKSKKGYYRRNIKQEQIDFIREHAGKVYTQQELADMFNTTQAYISSIVNYKVRKSKNPL